MTRDLVLNKTNTNNMVYQLMGELAHMVAHNVVERLRETGEFFNQTITVEAETVENETPDELLTIQEVCKILKVKRGALNDWRLKNILEPDTYVGRSPRYKRATIQEYINNVEFKSKKYGY